MTTYDPRTKRLEYSDDGKGSSQPPRRVPDTGSNPVTTAVDPGAMFTLTADGEAFSSPELFGVLDRTLAGEDVPEDEWRSALGPWYREPEPDYGGAVDGFGHVFSDADPGL